MRGTIATLQIVKQITDEYDFSRVSTFFKVYCVTRWQAYHMPSYGLLTNPSNEILSEIRKICDLNFDYVEIAIEGPEGNPNVINKKKYKISKLLQNFNHKAIGHTAYWLDLF